MSFDDMVSCPSCGGAGGGPFGRAGSAWDEEEYVCPRCVGRGAVSAQPPVGKPGVAKAAPLAAPIKRRAHGEN